MFINTPPKVVDTLHSMMQFVQNTVSDYGLQHGMRVRVVYSSLCTLGRSNTTKKLLSVCLSVCVNAFSVIIITFLA